MAKSGESQQNKVLRKVLLALFFQKKDRKQTSLEAAGVCSSGLLYYAARTGRTVAGATGVGYRMDCAASPAFAAHRIL